MKQRVWASGILLLCAIFAILLYELALQPRSEKRKTQSALSFPNFNPDQVKRIELSRKGIKNVLVKVEDHWLVETENNFPADPEGVEKLLEATKKLSCTQEVSTSEKEYERFDLTPDQALEVKLFGEKDLLANFYIGKRGTSYSSSYYRKAGKEQICLTFQNLITIFDRTNDTWRDKAIFNFNAGDCKALQIQDGATSYSLEKKIKENKWELVRGSERKLAALWAVDGICQTLSRLKTQGFPEEPLEKTGVANPKKSITITLVGGQKFALLVGERLQDKSGYYVKRADQDTIYQLAEWQINSLFKNPNELLEIELKTEPQPSTGSTTPPK